MVPKFVPRVRAGCRNPGWPPPARSGSCPVSAHMCFLRIAQSDVRRLLRMLPRTKDEFFALTNIFSPQKFGSALNASETVHLPADAYFLLYNFNCTL